MTESRDIEVFNPFANEYVDCFCRFKLHIDTGKLLSAELQSAISQAECELIDWIPIDEKARIEESFEINYRDEMA